ncbi:hypothetical protein [Hydrogenophaga sp.]|uniref:hypothetical protein n=1 Tax=Hydrogenophaga sp. TaxID=1904254 RepID=UPI00271C3D58|nr:hypothetical protein [Hydrogenophaga sp.]MDO9436731.1 hypothetical protein [Hydrogenophaga sp.]
MNVDKRSSIAVASHEAVNLSPKVGWWQQLVAFLNQDVSTIFRRARADGAATGRKAFYDIEPEGTIASLVDTKKLQELVFQRAILDWRDGAHARLTTGVINLQHEFNHFISAEMGKASFLTNLMAKSADEVLAESFRQRVIAPLMSLLHREQEALAACMDRGGHSKTQAQWFDGQILNTDLAWLQPWAFKPSKQKDIAEAVDAWMSGKEGVASRLRQQVTYTADRLMENNRVC